MGSKLRAPFCFGYKKLASSSSGQEPLLLDMGNDHPECMEVLKFEIDATVKKSNESMERRNMALESDIRDLRSSITRVEQSVSKASVKENNSAHLEKEVCELRSAVSRIDSMVKSKPTPVANGGKETYLALKKDFDKHEIRLSKLELDSLWDHAKEDVAKLLTKNSELEKRVVELATTINELKAAAYSPSKNKVAMEKLVWEKCGLEKRVMEIESTIDRVKALSGFNGSPQTPQSMGGLWTEPRSQHPGMSELIICLLVLIFLICVVIGINLRSM